MLSRIGLGTAQLGMRYGIANSAGQPSEEESHGILLDARMSGISLFDTAAAYGESEALLGTFIARDLEPSSLRVVSKLPHFSGRPLTSESYMQALRTSLKTMGTDQLYAWLVHDVHDVTTDPVVFARAAEQAKESGLALKTGASVYTPDEVDQILDCEGVDLMQLPLSILDQRCLESGALTRLKDRGIEVHARSLFLQGALLMGQGALPGHLVALRPSLQRLEAVARGLGATPFELSLRFAASVKQVDCWIVGVDTRGQLRTLVEAARFVAATSYLAADVDLHALASNDPSVVDPRRWRRS